MPPDARTRFVFLLGDPVAHSLSPRMHNAAFRHQGLNWVYLAARVPADALAEAVQGLRALGAAGANVTLPHKQAVVPLMDTLSPAAEAVGAVNTIVVRPGDGSRPGLHGDNTDVAGFLAPLEPRAADLTGQPMTVLGAGGAARAVVYALLRAFRPARLTVVARSPERARPWLDAFARHDPDAALTLASPPAARDAVRASRLVVNATPAGMHPHIDQTPWPYPDDFTERHLVYDLIYTPEQTRLLREAAARGAATLGGLAMLIGQAAAAYRQWTGRPMPLDAVRAALRTEP
ncbi:MAG: shikimate dehydrogenase [Bacteroidetes bacterium]|nr:MAG: shikimate dehydrogenase [Bacteroidota bacterium]